MQATLGQRGRQRMQRHMRVALAAVEFKALFDLRSAHVHGRPMAPISSADRFRARRLARRGIVALMGQALGQDGDLPSDREAFLIALARRS